MSGVSPYYMAVRGMYCIEKLCVSRYLIPTIRMTPEAEEVYEGAYVAYHDCLLQPRLHFGWRSHELFGYPKLPAAKQQEAREEFLTGVCCYVAAVVLSQLLCQLSVLLLSAVLLNCERHYGVRHSKTGQATYT